MRGRHFSKPMANVCVLAMSVMLSRCNCSEELQGAGPPVPQIDICVQASAGQEVCYEAEKQARRVELCNGTEECRRPELDVDFGSVPAQVGGNTPVVIRNVGGANLVVEAPENTPGGSNWFVPQGVDDWYNTPRTLAPGEEMLFDVKLRGNVCGPHSARWAFKSNDATVGAAAPGAFDPGQPDTPIFVNFSGQVSGPCLCPPSQGTIDFGIVPLGSDRVKRFTFESCGDAPLQITNTVVGLDPAGVFSLEGTVYPPGDLLQPGETGSVDVKYTPVAEAPPPDAGELHISGNGPTMQPHYPVFLIGRGAPRPECKLGAFPQETSFGQVMGSATRSFRIFNDGDIACRVFDVSRVSGSTDFTHTAGGPPPDITLQPNDSFQLEITFTPSTTTEQTAVFRVSADDVAMFPSSIDITVRGNPPVAMGNCVVEVQPDSGDFGDISVGDQSQINFNITNLGSGISFPPCSITSVEVTGSDAFTAGDLGPLAGFFLPPGGGTSVTVTCEPDDEGIHTGNLRVVSPGGNFDLPLFCNALGAKLCVDVMGNVPGTTQCGPSNPCDTVDFGMLTPPATATRDVTLTNCGAGRLNVRGINMDPAGGLAFIKRAPAVAGTPACTGGTCIPFELGPGQSETVEIEYRPTSGNPAFGGFDVLSNASGAETARIALRGNYDGNCPRIIRCNPSSIAFGSQELDTSNVRSAICTNFGTENLVVNNASFTGDPALRVIGNTYADLAPGDSFQVQMECIPTTAGSKTGMIEVTSDACDLSPLGLGVECSGVDNPLPLCIGSSTFEPEEKWRWTVSPDYPEYDDVWMTPVVINLTDDNSDGVVDVMDTPDVIFTALKSSMSFGPGGGQGMGMDAFCHANDAQPAVVIALSGDDGHQLWSWGILPAAGDPGDPNALAMETEGTLAAGDIDADGLPEIVGVKYTYIPPPDNCDMTDLTCCVKGKYAFGSLIALEHDGTYKWESERWHLPELTLENAGAPSLGDMDGDGFPEISFGNAVFDHNGILLFEGDTETLTDAGHGNGNAGHGPISVLVDLDSDGTNELVAGRTAFDLDGSIMWDRSDLGDGLSTTANFDTDAEAEIILHTGGNDVLVLNHDGSTLYGPIHIASGNVDENGNEEGYITTNPAVGDLDGDGFPEVVIAATNLVHVFEHDLQPKWTQAISDQTGASGPTTFDFEGDGKAEVVYADEGSVYIWDGVDGGLKYQAPRSSRTIVDNPVIADVDNDGHADIILANERPTALFGGLSGLIVYGNVKNNWVSTKRVWNQHAYHITNVSESGVVPAVEGSGWLNHNVYRSNVVRCE